MRLLVIGVLLALSACTGIGETTLRCDDCIKVQGNRVIDGDTIDVEFIEGSVENARQRRDGRVDEGGGLENRYMGDCIVGSNPTPSASFSVSTCIAREFAYDWAESQVQTAPRLSRLWPRGPSTPLGISGEPAGEKSSRPIARSRHSGDGRS